MDELEVQMRKQAPNESLASLLKEQIQGTKKVDKKKEFPTVRADIVVGIHSLRNAVCVLHALEIAVPSLKAALEPLRAQISNATAKYSRDVDNLELELSIANEAEDSLGAKLMEAEARFKLKCDEVEQGHLRMFEKNEGFVETLQLKNREAAALESKIAGLEFKLDQYRVAKEELVQGNNEAERYIKVLLTHITRDGAKHLPAKLRRFG